MHAQGQPVVQKLDARTGKRCGRPAGRIAELGLGNSSMWVQAFQPEEEDDDAIERQRAERLGLPAHQRLDPEWPGALGVSPGARALDAQFDHMKSNWCSRRRFWCCGFFHGDKLRGFQKSSAARANHQLATKIFSAN